MGFLKKITKGIKKAFRSAGKFVNKLTKNKAFKFIAIAAAAVFTAGAAAGFLGISTTAGSGFFGTLASNGLTSGVFAAGSNLGAGLSAATGLGGAASSLSGAATGATTGALQTAGYADVALGAPAAIGSGGAAAATSGGGGILSSIGGAITRNPGAALLAGNIIEGIATPKPETYEDQMRARDRRDNRYGVNNVTGQGPGVAPLGQAPRTQLPSTSAQLRSILARTRAGEDPLQPRSYGAV